MEGDNCSEIMSWCTGTMLKGYRYRIYPNEAQKKAFAHHFGCARFVYNWALERRRSHYQETGKTLSKRTLQDELVALKRTEDKKWLSDVNSQTLLASLMNLENAYQKFFKKEAGHPTLKKKYVGHQSFQCPQHVTIDIEQQRLQLPKIKDIQICLHRKFEGKIKTCTVKRTPTHKYYISILIETEEANPMAAAIEPDKTLGIDLGIKAFLITSEGQLEQNPHFLGKNLKKLKQQHRRLSKKKKNSKNRVKAKRKLAKLHEKIVHQRQDLIHQTSAKLVYKSHDTCFAVEDLNIKGMMGNHKLARAIGECGWRLFLNAMQYKAVWSGKTLLIIDRFAPSSKRCSCCGNDKEYLTLAERTYHCEYCGMILDRDVNAARNIKHFALAKIGLEWPESKPVDHALAGAAMPSKHGLKQEARTIALA